MDLWYNSISQYNQTNKINIDKLKYRETVDNSIATVAKNKRHCPKLGLSKHLINIYPQAENNCIKFDN